MDRKYVLLHQYFGYTEFRSGQETLIDALLQGKDVMGIMPTGGGKSLCYQIPALMMEGVTLVISPLISLMKDQVAALKNAGVAVAYINSSLSAAQTRTVYQRCRQGAYQIIYVAPERLQNEAFLSMIQEIHVSMVAVDEAHCISQWGPDFRPSYLKIIEFIAQLPYRPVVSAFTATATQQVQEDIERTLRLNHAVKVVTGFDRPNLRFEVLHPEKKKPALLGLLDKRKQESGIVYCSTRKEVENICSTLQEKGYLATRYHAGLTEQERQNNQEAFTYDRQKIMVATNAFGMGIDKSNISFVIHYNMPKSMEAYYQEAGRAGRDGSAADCILLYSSGDVTTARRLIERSSDGAGTRDREDLNRDIQRLHAMEHYCHTVSCLRGYILDYFGQEHEDNCENCSNCDTKFECEDITTYAKMILSCIKRIDNHLGYFLGPAMVIRVLMGSKDKRIEALGLHQLSTYGLMRGHPGKQIHEMLSILEEQGFLYTEFEHGTVRLTKKAGEVLFHGKTVEGYFWNKQEEKSPAKVRTGTQYIPDTATSDLFEALKALRQKIAKKENVPAYIVFSNATLMDMARRRPESLDQFLAVSGVGVYKAERYGEAFLDEIIRHGSDIGE